MDVVGDPEEAVTQLKLLGAPVVFTCYQNRLQWWKQTLETPKLLEDIEAGQVSGFFEAHEEDFAPTTVFDGKTRRRLPGQQQLSFVDAGLMPALERLTGENLSRLVESVIRSIETSLQKHVETKADVEAVFKSAFWLLAAKILRDKGVSDFVSLNFSDANEVFRRVGEHYGDTDGLPPGGKAWQQAIEVAASLMVDFPSLSHISTESLAYLYENTLISPEVRKALGTHSTPSALVDYMVLQLWPWIEELPEEDRHVFEPACGHAAFLVSAMRLLRQESSLRDEKQKHDYLRTHLHGVEVEAFALEIARLSLTLADAPHGNSWDLEQADMFAGSLLEDRVSSCGILLANPPFGKLAAVGREDSANTTAGELLRRTIPCLPANACLGVIVPHAFLHNKEGEAVRRELLSDFELAEIAVFPDNLFESADHEAAILLGRRRASGDAATSSVWFRRVRESDVDSFSDHFKFTFEEQIRTSRLAADPQAALSMPELDPIWRALGSRPQLQHIAMIRKGLEYKGADLPEGAWVIHEPARDEDNLGHARVPNDLMIFSTPPPVGMNLSEDVVRRWGSGKPTRRPQVLLNYAPVSRQAWKLKATLDEEGLALTSRFSAVRPRTDKVSALYLWALLNSPIANAYAYCHLGKRDILVGTMRKMPVPRWSPSTAQRVEQAASRYRELAKSMGPLFDTEATPIGLKQALLEMDAAVLQAYDLPPHLERQLLDLFTGVERKGVGCEFRGYYPPGFTSHLPLHLLISDDFERAAADRVSNQYATSPAPYVREVLAATAAEFDAE